METHVFQIPVSAPDFNAAQRKAQAGAAMLQVFTVEEIEKLVHIAIHEPVKRQMARQALGIG